jgi:O-antigen/teichoic acid export membrane protein
MSVLSLSIVGTATRIASIVVALAVSVLVARVLGPRGLGQFFLFVQLVTLLAVIADGGLSHSAAALSGRSPGAVPYFYGLALRTLPVLAAVTVAAAAAVLGLFRDTVLPHLPTRLFWIAFAALPCAVYSNLWIGMLSGLGRIREASVAQLVGSGCWLLLTVVFVAMLNGGVAVAATVYFVSLLIQAVVMGVMAVRIVGWPSVSAPAPGAGREFLSFAARAFPGAIGYLLLIRMPAFLLNVFDGPAAVGVFSAAQQVVERTLLPVTAVQAATYLVMSSTSRAASTLAVNRYLRLCWTGMATIVAVGMVLAAPGVHLLLGARYSGAVAVCRVLFPGTLFLGGALILDAFFLNQLRRPGLVSLLTAAELVLLVVLGLVLIPARGVIGAALSLTIAQVTGTLVYLRWHMSVTGATFRELFVPSAGELRAVLRHGSLRLAKGRRS